MEKTYVVTGATGNVGKTLVEILRQNGHQVKAVGRNTDKLKPLEDIGAQVVVGDLSDEAFLTHTFKGADGVFFMIPPHFVVSDWINYQQQMATVGVNAVKHSGVKHVVTLSSVGAELTSGGGIIQGLHDMETFFNTLENTHVVHLRAGFFMENLLGNIELIQTQGMNGTAIAPDVPLAMVATQDIAVVAAEELVRLDKSEKRIRYVLGPRDLTMNEATDILRHKLGRDSLPYVQFSYEDAGHAFLQLGFSPDCVKEYMQFLSRINEREIYKASHRDEESTTSTSFEEFAEWLVDTYVTAT